MMLPSEVEAQFRAMLSEAGFDEVQPDPLLAWRAFRRFAATPVECTDDALLFQCGVYDFTGRDLFHFDLVRQFSFNEDGEFDHMEQFHCTFFYEPIPELRGFETNLWTCDCAGTDDFFGRVEALPEFQAPQGRVAIRAEIYREQV